MGKLILGIVAVIVLQIAYFTYLAMDGMPVYKNAPVAKKPSVNEIARSDRAAKSPDTSTRSTPPIGDTVYEPSKLRAAARPDQTRPATKLTRDGQARFRNSPVHGRNRSVVRAAFSKPSNDFQRVPLRGVTITYRQYATAMTDYPKRSDTETNNSVKRKKRPLLARVFLPVVKKPWRWMKSIASKFD